VGPIECRLFSIALLQEDGFMPSSPDYLTPLVSGLIGVLGTLLGASIAGFFQLRHSTKQRQYERASIAAAFATEINIQVQGVRLRRHEESVKALLVDLQAGSVGSDAIAAKVKPLLTRGADAGHPIFRNIRRRSGSWEDSQNPLLVIILAF
jgi:hypothetical protein